MPLRDIIVIGIVFGSLPVCFARPYVGVLVWSWLGFMSPHRLTWGIAYDMQFAQMVAIATLAGLAFTKDRRPIPLGRESGLLFVFWALTALSSVFALYPDLAWKDFKEFSKILLMSFVTMALFQDRVKLRYLLLVAALSIGFFGVKGALWALVTGGEHGWVLGPEGSFIGDNNGLALGLDMALPLLFFLAREEPQRWLRRLLNVAFGLSIAAVPFTYSRGGFLGLVVVLGVLTARTKWRMLIIPAALVGAIVLVSFLPERWMDRIATISTYDQDGSAMSRLWAWGIAWQLALESPLVGGGFRVFSAEIWARYMPGYGDWHNAHSIYFQVLAEHGFTGLVLFLGVVGSTFWTLRGVRRDARRVEDGAWLVNYSYMVEASLLAFVVTGTFYNLAYIHLVYFLVVVAVILKRLTQDALAKAGERVATRVADAAGHIHAEWKPLAS